MCGIKYFEQRGKSFLSTLLGDYHRYCGESIHSTSLTFKATSASTGLKHLWSRSNIFSNLHLRCLLRLLCRNNDVDICLNREPVSEYMDGVFLSENLSEVQVFLDHLTVEAARGANEKMDFKIIRCRCVASLRLGSEHPLPSTS